MSLTKKGAIKISRFLWSLMIRGRLSGRSAARTLMRAKLKHAVRYSKRTK